ncbi:MULTISPECIES: NAD-dependent succinate-semialdehyde dehydrogenase [unclassified Pseudomonas]|uniref:NAD-dependent succinate-semialdehyde dehydrogenase n=1 Tax=unclassified Pseudomonas TaxID=196821 RepID=UPI000BD804CD|nr:MULTISPECIES: NAD-dependent succinate-semialdehyde dehydrogenase [unclassified Pseudomonas]PVZ19615.1 succinate-semialdehyde dehydrogenase/glutarate-semialdehyde dehydrogenase [Pseudomonas sp. URIL14HWK12:I12]PVZ22800.1 succinate-semialdehyde dehydrogenase/glutarate-semialdehyde dehydrogenase [Pseudomonas sp. URIL14HWK12:I10]PVZ37570.1 succinate-semialdehyde dehydrogenase/glutarate-semialdehyde dehydrogenase [Pseudomonas sp. URIL14HWK12:I11]SNZ15139.1 succinate semialdehyde dehydrogenase [Ps
MNYPDILLHIDGQWRPALAGSTLPVVNPANGEVIGQLAKADQADLDAALAAAERGFQTWRRTPAFERYKTLRKAAVLLRERAEGIARLMTLEQGKPLAEARAETLGAADTIDWLAEEGRRSYGRIIPARAAGVEQKVIREPVGPVAAFTPWNFPINQVVRKLTAALATGCSIIVKAPEETPASPAELVRAFVDAGVPNGVIGLVYGDPGQISSYLIPHPVIRKVTFTGSTGVGKQLAALAGQHMKRVTMELGGHAPALVFADADLDEAAKLLVASKFRNAGQVCISPTRMLVERSVYEAFAERFVAHAKTLKVGDGLAEGTQMGPLANDRRAPALRKLIEDAKSKGATELLASDVPKGPGYFFGPTVLGNMTPDMAAMNEEPFGPLALLMPFDTLEQALAEANRLPYGLASYAFTTSTRTAQALSDGIEAGMLTINHMGLGLPEVPFGGVQDSGYGSEGGTEAIEAYLNTKLVTQRG